MKKLLLCLLSLCLLPAFALAGTDASVIAKLEKVQPLSFPQNYFDDSSAVQKAAKAALEKNPESFAANYNYAVVLSNEEMDEGRYIEPKNAALAVKYYNKALEINPKSASAHVALADLTLYQLGLDWGSFSSPDGDKLWVRQVGKNRKEVQGALAHFKKGKTLGYKGKFPLDEMIGNITSAFQRLDKAAIKKGLSGKTK